MLTYLIPKRVYFVCRCKCFSLILIHSLVRSCKFHDHVFFTIAYTKRQTEQSFETNTNIHHNLNHGYMRYYDIFIMIDSLEFSLTLLGLLNLPVFII